MAFEKVKKELIVKRTTPTVWKVTVGKIGSFYLGRSIVADFPITQQHKTAEIYFDVETDQVAIEPKEDGTGQFKFGKQSGSVILHCAGLINKYGILRRHTCMVQIEDVYNSRMIVFKVNRDKVQEHE